MLYLLLSLQTILINQSSDSITLPATFHHDLISISIPISSEDTLHLYTDTGGKNYLYKSGVKKLGIKPSRKNMWGTSSIEMLFSKRGIPIPHEKEIYFIRDKTSSFDGMLGREWFAAKVWQFDYKEQTLVMINTKDRQTIDQTQSVKLHFRTDATNHPEYHLPRIQITVASDTLSMLLDTGAQAFLSEAAQKKLKKGELVATSFINASTFDQWKRQHPEWVVLAGADLSFRKPSDIIVVPEVTIGNKTVGPVEFTRREDANFEVMSDYFMDAKIVGAIGGNALSQLQRFTIDYQKEWLIQNSSQREHYSGFDIMNTDSMLINCQVHIPTRIDRLTHLLGEPDTIIRYTDEHEFYEEPYSWVLYNDIHFKLFDNNQAQLSNLAFAENDYRICYQDLELDKETTLREISQRFPASFNLRDTIAVNKQEHISMRFYATNWPTESQWTMLFYEGKLKYLNYFDGND